MMQTQTFQAVTLLDGQGRIIENLRISVTDRCNLRCRYCMPPGTVTWHPTEHLLRYEEITDLIEIFAQLGIRKIRITGGEPLMRRDIHKLIAMLRNIPGILDVAMTTNGVFLKESLPALESAGLKRINVSLDALDPEVFKQLTFRDTWHEIIAGLEALAHSSISPVKINAVIMRGINESEILKLAYLAVNREFHVRFIEYMPIGAGHWSPDHFISGAEVKARIEQEVPLRLIPETEIASPSINYQIPGAKGTIGFINSVTQPFCHSCNRIRITADGYLRTCLFSTQETDLRTPLRSGTNQEEIARIVLNAIAHKEPGHLINHPEFEKPKRTMSQIGG